MTNSTFAHSLNRPHSALRFAGACLALCAAVSTARAQSEDLARIWSDPTFQKQFVAGYGVNAEIEPRFTPDEVKILEKIRPLMSDDKAKAEESLRQQMKPDSSAMLDFTLGSLQFERDDLKGALETFQRAVRKFPSFRRAWRNLGFIHFKNGDNDNAIKAFTRMIELGGGDASAYGMLGYAHAAKQDYQPSEAAFRNALLLQPDYSEWRLGLTNTVFKQNKFDDAAALLDVLIARYPDKAQFWLLQAHTFLGKKQPLRAAENFEIMDRLGKSTTDTLNTLGDIYLTEGLPDLALNAYVRAIDLDKTQPSARSVRAAEVLAARGGSRQALRLTVHIRDTFQSALPDAERTKLLKLQARLAMAEGSGDEEAAAALLEIVRLDPLDGDALLLLGQHHARRGEPDQAIFFYERAASIEAFEGKAKVYQAQVLVGLNRYADALTLLRRAQEIKPREDIARYIEQVERVSRQRR